MQGIKTFAVNKVEVSDIGVDFLKLTIYAITDGLNRNDSIFTLDSMNDAIPTIPNKPVLAYYNPVMDDAESHNLQIKQDSKTGEYYEDFDSWGSEKPIGVIPMDSNIKIENLNGRNWLCFEAVLWVNYNRNLVQLLKKQRRKKVSVEVQILDSTWQDNIETINKFKFHGVTLLGNNIVEGIPGAHLSLDEVAQSERFAKFNQALTFAYQGKDVIDNTKEKGGEKVPGMENFISKDKIGTGKTLNISDSKESVSKDSWGSVDKSALKKACLTASNYSSICPKVFLQLLDGWKDGKEGSLKYPVMQMKDNTLVYNRYGLSSALAYAKQHGDKDVVSKVNAIYKKLGLDKEEEDMKKNAKKYGYLDIGQSTNHLFLYKDGKTYAAPVDGDDDTDEEKFKAQLVPVGIQAKMEESEEVFEVRMEGCHSETMDALEKAKMEAETGKMEAEEKLSKMEEEKKTMEADRTKMDDMEKKLAAMEEEKKDFEAKLAKMEEEKKDFEAKFTKMEEEVKVSKHSALMEEVKTMAEEKGLDTKDFEEVEKMAEEGKFASKADAEKEVVYRSYLKSNQESLKMGIHDKTKPVNKNTSIFEDLKQTVKLSK